VITADRVSRALAAAAPRRSGVVSRVVGLNVEIEGLEAAIGDTVIVATGGAPLETEVVAVRDGGLVCLPYGDLKGVRSGARADAYDRPATIAVGPELLGRVLDGLGNPLDGGPSLATLDTVTLDGAPPHPLLRARVDRQLPLGVRALDTLIPCGRGQRLGIFAGSGVGKSSLLSMIARGTEAQVNVIALIGERGREVREFLENDLGPEGMARSIVVVATSDQPALVRLRAAFVATRIAEYFRDGGADVLLMMDSVTRFAMAQREVGLSAGEPPATRGYPPSVFALLPKLLERAGAGEHGSITGLYTVLVEGDDMNEPIGDAARSILDGHIVLSRKLAVAGHFPSIDVLESISRVTNAITTPEQRAAATELRKLLAAHREARDLIEIGAYVPGSNPLVDRAIALREVTDLFLRQDMDDTTPVEQSWSVLEQMVAAA
jgi:flagellum-specific ATP synthase